MNPTGPLLRSSPRLLHHAALALALILTPAYARADDAPDPAKKAAAQALFDEARRLTADNRYEEACPKFAESLRLDPTIGTKFYLAECLERTGKLASAWSYYVEVADAARAAGQVDRDKFARDRAEAIKGKLPKLIIDVPAELRALPGFEIKRDGILVGEAQWGLPIPVDPGTHTLFVTAKGKKSWVSSVEVPSEQTITIAISPLAEAPAPPPEKIAPEKRPAPLPESPPPKPAGSGQKIAALAAGAAGLAGIGVGSIFGVMALSKQNQSNADGHCDAANTCDPTGLTLRAEAIDAATVSTIGFIAGGALLAGSAVLFFTAPSNTPSNTQKSGFISTQVALGPGGFSIKGAW